jgi:hypothetical protein
LAAASRADSGGRTDDYDEIDQIYDYVRGFAPLPKTAKGWHYNSDGGEGEDHRRRSASAVLVLDVGRESNKGGGGHYGRIYAAKSENSENRPPEPPPIETIPSRRGGAAVINSNNNNNNSKGGDGSNNSPMELTPPVTPPFSPAWGSPVHGVTLAPLGPSGQIGGIMSGIINSSPSHLIYER